MTSLIFKQLEEYFFQALHDKMTAGSIGLSNGLMASDEPLLGTSEFAKLFPGFSVWNWLICQWLVWYDEELNGAMNTCIYHISVMHFWHNQEQLWKLCWLLIIKIYSQWSN